MKKLIMMMAACAMIMVACSNDEEEPVVDRHDYGFFTANVNGDSICILDAKENSDKFGGFWTGDDENDITNSRKWSVKYHVNPDGSKYILTFFLPSITIGSHWITESPTGTLSPESPAGISIRLEDRDRNVMKYYEPMAEKRAFQLTVRRIWIDMYNPAPAFEGMMDGILYNRENLKDSIIIKNAKFGAY